MKTVIGRDEIWASAYDASVLFVGTHVLRHYILSVIFLVIGFIKCILFVAFVFLLRFSLLCILSTVLFSAIISSPDFFYVSIHRFQFFYFFLFPFSFLFLSVFSIVNFDLTNVHFLGAFFPRLCHDSECLSDRVVG